MRSGFYSQGLERGAPGLRGLSSPPGPSVQVRASILASFGGLGRHCAGSSSVTVMPDLLGVSVHPAGEESSQGVDVALEDLLALVISVRTFQL